MKVVPDTNVLLVAIGKKSRYNPIWSSFLSGRYQLILSDEILFEYREVFTEHAVAGAAEIILEIFADSPHTIHQTIFYNWNAITADADDNKFFDAAVAANADYLVTNDSHFNEVKTCHSQKSTLFQPANFCTYFKACLENFLHAIFSNAIKFTSSPPVFQTGYSSTRQL